MYVYIHFVIINIDRHALHAVLNAIQRKNISCSLSKSEKKTVWINVEVYIEEPEQKAVKKFRLCGWIKFIRTINHFDIYIYDTFKIKKLPFPVALYEALSPSEGLVFYIILVFFLCKLQLLLSIHYCNAVRRDIILTLSLQTYILHITRW